MEKWKIVLAMLLVTFLLLFIGDRRNDVLEIHNDGGTMCLSCIGLE